MDTVVTVLVIRFAVIVGVLVALALLVFAVVLVLRRQDRLDEARRRAGAAARVMARRLDEQAERRPGPGAGSRRTGLIRAVIRTAARHLDGEDEDPRPRADRRRPDPDRRLR